MLQKNNICSAAIATFLIFFSRACSPSVSAAAETFLKTEHLPVMGFSGKTAGVVTEGKASYYADRFHGRRTASGETFRIHDFTAAHRTLPFGTSVKVTNLDNGKEVVVRINDRGPHLKSRVIDVSPAAAHILGLIEKGTVNVRIEAWN